MFRTGLAGSLATGVILWLPHRATLDTPKRELIHRFLASRRWADGLGQVRQVRQVASYRFDDPDGEVGLESARLTNAEEATVHGSGATLVLIRVIGSPAVGMMTLTGRWGARSGVLASCA